MEQSSSQSSVVWYNYNPVDGVLTPGGQVELGSTDLGKSIGLNQPVQIHYNNFSSVATQPQHVVVNPPPQEQISSLSSEIIDETSLHETKVFKKIKSGERIPCEECGKTFSCNANLRDHARLHTGERPFSCSECGMSFAQRSNWRLHKRVHTGERPYMCGICGKTFSRSSHLPGHMRIHTGERPYRCDSCKQSFSSAQALKNHSRTHTGEKPFCCEFCLTSFTHSSSLSSHRKRCNGQKRKRGRPLGSGGSKGKFISGRRGRAKKKKSGKGRGRKRSIKSEDVDSVATADIKSETESLVDSSNINVDTDMNEVPNISIKTDVMDLAVQILHSTNPEVESSPDILLPSTNEGVPILPQDSVVVTEDMVKAAASAAGIHTTTDLHQEAAVTMAALQHGALNLVHHNIPQEYD